MCPGCCRGGRCEMRVPDLTTIFWSLPVHLFGPTRNPFIIAISWLWRIGIVAVAVYIAVAKFYTRVF